jgi:putative inorganic carbon (HCO3(-)) transporter
MLQTLERLSAGVALNTWDAPAAHSLKTSRLLSVLLWPLLWLRQYLQPFVAESLLARWIPTLSFQSVLLLLFASPFLESGLNGVLVALAGGLTLIRLLLCAHEELPLGSLSALLLLFVAWGLVSTGFSPFLKLSLYGYAKTLTYLIAYVCFLVNLQTLTQLRLAAWAIILSAVIVSLYGLYQWHIKVPPLALWDDPSAEYKLTRVYSFLGNPNLLAGYLLPPLALTAFFYFGNLGWRKWLLLLCFPLQVLCLYFTYCRGAWLALAAGGVLAFGVCLIIFWHLFARSALFKGLLLAGCLLFLAGGLWMVLHNPALLERLRSLISGGGHSSNQFRLNVWQSSFKIIQDFGLTGIGMGNKVFQKIYTYYMVTGFQALSTYNIFLEVWVEMGLVGLLLFIAMLVTHAARCIWGIVQDIDYTARLFLAASLIGLTGLLVHGMVDTVFYRPSIQVLFWFFLAVITLVSRRDIAFNPQSTP